MSVTDSQSLYVHIPFCSTRCGYCHFNTYEGLEKLFEPFTRALCGEIERYAQDLAGFQKPARSIFFGGGTPTHLPIAHFERILQTLRAEWQWTDDIEITSEANPSFITQAYLERLRAAGINRISFGAQAFDAKLLRMLDREHSVAQIGEAVAMARRAGFDNLNLDLMYGLPRQTLAQWRASLDAAMALQAEHLSLYGLTIDEGTAFKKRVEKGLLPEPDPDLAADMYELAESMLAEAEYQQYEISNWAKTTTADRLPTANGNGAVSGQWSAFKSCRHNLTYWLNEPYLGFGPGA
ncbi:MAG: radical SAM family heme chaperone HemW, partial [Chloroflexota bacterium]